GLDEEHLPASEVRTRIRGSLEDHLATHRATVAELEAFRLAPARHRLAPKFPGAGADQAVSLAALLALFGVEHVTELAVTAATRDGYHPGRSVRERDKR